MARDNQGFVCHNHKHLVSYEMHHVWPKEYHGPNVKSNLVKICPNAHSDIHFLMDKMLAGKPYNSHEYGNKVFTLARKGYLFVTAYANTLVQQIESQK